MEPLTPEQIGFVMKQVGEWLDIRNGKNLHTGFADACHSALLNRLLEGKKHLSKPPPRRFSYPSYELGEGLPVTIQEIHDRPATGYAQKDEWNVIIDQCGDWKWLHKDSGLLQHRNGDTFKYDFSTKQLVKIK